jgi:hypothetical protein
MPDPESWFRRGASPKVDDGGADRWRLQPPAVHQEASWQAGSAELNADDFPHRATVPSLLAACLPAKPRICRLLCRFRADRAGGERAGLTVAASMAVLTSGPRCQERVRPHRPPLKSNSIPP